MNIIIILIFSIICAILYRCGGSGNYPRQMRVVGIPTIITGLLFFGGIHSYWLLAVFGMLIASISTYWDFLHSEEENRDDFYLHGLFIGISFFPIAIVTGQWWVFIVRSCALGLAMGVLHRFVRNAVAEELIRGSLIPLSLFWV